jgi:hypothetical protein
MHDVMRRLLESPLCYQNPIYLVLCKTEQRRPILVAFLHELQNTYRMEALPEPAKKPRKAAE